MKLVALSLVATASAWTTVNTGPRIPSFTSRTSQLDALKPGEKVSRPPPPLFCTNSHFFVFFHALYAIHL